MSVLYIFLEKEVMQPISSVSGEPRPKRHRRDSPLEEAVLKELIDCMEGENNRFVTRWMSNSYWNAPEAIYEYFS